MMPKKFDWTLRNKLRDWKRLDNQSQEALLRELEIVDGGSWLYCRAIVELMDDGDIKRRERLLRAFVRHGTSRDFGRDEYIDKMLSLCSELGVDKLKNILLSCENKRLHRMVLGFPNLTVKEEEAGLRGLAFYSSCPESLYQANYTPSYEALLKMPTVTRLKVIEALLDNKHIGYNIFKNINADAIEPLLFGSSLRHKDRVASVCEAHKYFSKLDTKSTVVISYDCSVCGQYDVTLNSTKIHAEEDFKHTGNARALIWKTCMFCKSKMKNISFRKA